MTKKRHAHDSQREGVKTVGGWGGRRRRAGGRAGGREDKGWMLLFGGGVLGSEKIVAIVT